MTVSSRMVPGLTHARACTPLQQPCKRAVDDGQTARDRGTVTRVWGSCPGPRQPAASGPSLWGRLETTSFPHASAAPTSNSRHAPTGHTAPLRATPAPRGALSHPLTRLPTPPASSSVQKPPRSHSCGFLGAHERSPAAPAVPGTHDPDALPPSEPSQLAPRVTCTHGLVSELLWGPTQGHLCCTTHPL